MTSYVGFAIIGAVAAVVTYVGTFVVRRLATRFSIIVVPDETRVHEKPTPTVGGAAMFVGFLVAMGVASRLPQFKAVFHGSSEPLGLVLAAAVIFTVFVYDDLREMSAPAKVAGQVLAGTVLYVFGLTWLFFRVPLAGTTLVLSRDLIPVFTVLWVVGMANAVNLIDGLDGLAAGIVGIASLAFFLYAHRLLQVGTIGISNTGPLVAVIVLGLCVGFLPHNFHPAKIFMGDSGAMLLGLLMAACTMAVVGQTDSAFASRTYFTFAPAAIPFIILGIPILDTAFAIVRRAGRRGSLAERDIDHLHHRLMRLGHGQVRSVLILWTWTALLSALVLYPALTGKDNVVVPIGVVALFVALYTVFAPRGKAVAESPRHAAPTRSGSKER
ncbi:MAG: glycosyltransferase family 4 protein [Acidimicrobiales bacterium]